MKPNWEFDQLRQMLDIALAPTQAHEHECSVCLRVFGHPKHEPCPIGAPVCDDCNHDYMRFFDAGKAN